MKSFLTVTLLSLWQYNVVFFLLKAKRVHVRERGKNMLDYYFDDENYPHVCFYHHDSLLQKLFLSESFEGNQKLTVVDWHTISPFSKVFLVKFLFFSEHLHRSLMNLDEFNVVENCQSVLFRSDSSRDFFSFAVTYLSLFKYTLFSFPHSITISNFNSTSCEYFMKSCKQACEWG